VAAGTAPALDSAPIATNPARRGGFVAKRPRDVHLAANPIREAGFVAKSAPGSILERDGTMPVASFTEILNLLTNLEPELK
jgi:hypothetical protein